MVVDTKRINRKNGGLRRKRGTRGCRPPKKPKRRMSSQKWTISLVKQGKSKVGVVPADRLGCLLLKIIIMEGGCLAMLAGANINILDNLIIHNA
jgi:hypothetical protein